MPEDDLNLDSVTKNVKGKVIETLRTFIILITDGYAMMPKSLGGL